MKKICMVFFILLLGGVFSIYAQDIITLKNGNEIKAKVLEITPTEIKYKRYENLEGPTVVIRRAEVYAITYENGETELITTSGSGSSRESSIYSAPAMDPDKVYYGIWANPLGFVTFGPMFGFEITKNRFNVDFSLRLPSLGLMMKLIESGFEWFDNVTLTSGFGIGATFKFFMPSRIGGFYAGAMLEYSQYTADWKGNGWYGDSESKVFALGSNLGYKFVFNSFYMRTGAYLGAAATIDGYYKENDYGYDKYTDRTGDVTFFYLFDLALGVQF